MQEAIHSLAKFGYVEIGPYLGRQWIRPRRQYQKGLLPNHTIQAATLAGENVEFTACSYIEIWVSIQGHFNPLGKDARHTIIYDQDGTCLASHGVMDACTIVCGNGDPLCAENWLQNSQVTVIVQEQRLHVEWGRVTFVGVLNQCEGDEAAAEEIWEECARRP